VQALPQIAQLRGATGKLAGFAIRGAMTLKALNGTTIVCAPLQAPGMSACPGASSATANATLVTTNAEGLDPARVYATLYCGTLAQIGLFLNFGYHAGHLQGTGTAAGALPGVTLSALAIFDPGGGLSSLNADGTHVHVGPLDLTESEISVTPSGTTG